ncbi:MAG: phosphoglycolate phosphatase [Nitrospirae bacterium]|nr:phosphoglycolate phosphatase [Nitrospirota bacterium]
MKAVVIDIDGTLTDEKRQLSCEATKAVRNMEIPVILASGNVLCFVKCTSKLIGASDIIIAENGGVISMGYDGPVYVKGNKERCKNALHLLKQHLELEELDNSLRCSEVALRRNFDIQGARDILVKEGIHDIEIIDTGFAVHIKTTEVNKGTGLAHVAALMKIDPKDFAAIGDSANDIEMLEAAGLGFAVANAHPDLKHVADHVTSDPYGKGAIEAMEYIRNINKRKI